MHISNRSIIIILCEMTVFFVLPEATLCTPVILVKVRDDTLFFFSISHMVYSTVLNGGLEKVRIELR